MLPSALDEYLSDVSDPFSFRDRFLDICGDVLFIVPTRRVANYHRDMKRVDGLNWCKLLFLDLCILVLIIGLEYI